MEKEIVDLDILRPKKRVVKVGGKEIDVSFIPCGITFEVDEISNKLRSIGEKKNFQNDPKLLKEAFLLGVELCSTFASIQYPEMDKDWFMRNSTAEQVQRMTAQIQDSLYSSYKAVDSHTKKSELAKGKGEMEK